MGGLGRGVSRDETVEIVTSFYNFLTTLPYLPPSTIQTPPAGGWPESDRQYLRKLGKSDTVRDLLTYLPYIDTRDWHIGYDTQPIHYTGQHVKLSFDHGFSLERALLSPQHEKIPEHVVALTYGEKYGSWLLFDTENGAWRSMTDLLEIDFHTSSNYFNFFIHRACNSGGDTY
jgi:hypothetical protein